MKDLRIMLLAAGAGVALLAAVFFSRPGGQAIRPDPATAPAASSSITVPALTPDSLLPVPLNSASAGPNLSAKAAAAKDLATGAILYGLGADARWPIASLTKIMTAQIVLDYMNPGAVVTMLPEDFTVGSSLTASLEPGDQYRVADLLKVLLLPSSNEAAEAFARSYGQSAFMTAMNAKAASWSLQSTHFADPSGVSVANQSTPREFLELVRRVYAVHPEIFSLTRAAGVTVTELSTGAAKYFSTTNNFAGRPGFLGGKTGTTPEAGDNLVSIFEVAGRPVAIAVFGAADRYAATQSLLQFIR